MRASVRVCAMCACVQVCMCSCVHVCTTCGGREHGCTVVPPPILAQRAGCASLGKRACLLLFSITHSPPCLLASLPPRLLLWFSRSPPGPASCSFTPQPCLLLLLSALPCLSDARILIQPPKTGWITAQLLRRVTPPELRAVHSGLTCGVAPGPKILPWSGSYPPGTCFCCHGGGNVRGGGSGGGSSWNNASSKGTWWKGCRRRCGHRSGGGGGDNAAAASSGAGGGAAGQSASVEAPRACQAPRPQKDCAGCPHCPHSVCGRRPVGRHCRYPGGGHARSFIAAKLESG